MLGDATVDDETGLGQDGSTQLQGLLKQLEAAQKAQAEGAATQGEAQPVDSGTFMGMSGGALFAGLVISTLGIAYIRYGKTSGQFAFAMFGLAMLVVPFFVTTALPLSAAGVALFVLPILMKRFVVM